MGDEISNTSDVNLTLSTSPPSVNITNHPNPTHAGHSNIHHHNIMHHYPASMIHEPNITSIMKDVNSATNSATTSANTSPSLTSIHAGNVSPNLGNFNLNFILNDTTTNPNNNNNNNNINNNTNTIPNPHSTTTPDNIQIISPPTTSPQIPDASGYLSCHTSICNDDKIIIFGGLYKVYFLFL